MAVATNPSHLVLARKWRPEGFRELVGQEHITRTLMQALKSGRIAHAFLFTGIRGVGKTTAARILARCLNCEQGPTPEPCGNCAACHEIRAGTALDVVEIDGATYRKIDDARAIIENLSYRPARDRLKIYIIDEAHQLTDQAFNALLKTLEEPPPHVKFILATTEPQKMPETILSRLQRYDFRRIPFALILARLKELTAREHVEVEEMALAMLAREAGGSMRDAERMLETVIASLDGKVGEAEVASILGVASRSRVFELVGAVLAKNAARALAGVRELHQRGANLESCGHDILEVLRNLTIVKLVPADSAQSPLADLPDQETAELRRLAEGVSSRDLMRLFRLMADAQEEVLRSPYPDLLLEMALIRMATLAPVMDAEELLRAIGRGGIGGGGDGGTGDNRIAAPADSPAGSSRVPIKGEVKADAPRKQPPSGAASPRAPGPAIMPSPNTAPARSETGLPDLREFIRGRRAALAGFMEQGATLGLEGDLLIVRPRNDIYIRYLGDNRNVIAELASEFYGRRILAELRSVDDNEAPPIAASSSPQPVNSPPAASDSSADEAEVRVELAVDTRPAAVPATRAEARQALYADPVVRRIFDELEARLVEVRMEPPSASPPGEATVEKK